MRGGGVINRRRLVTLRGVRGTGSVGRLARRRLGRLSSRVQRFLVRGVDIAKKRLTSGLKIIRLAVTLRGMLRFPRSGLV